LGDLGVQLAGNDDYYGVVKHMMDFSLDSTVNKQIIPFPKNYEQK